MSSNFKESLVYNSFRIVVIESFTFPGIGSDGLHKSKKNKSNKFDWFENANLKLYVLKDVCYLFKISTQSKNSCFRIRVSIGDTEVMKSDYSFLYLSARVSTLAWTN